MKTIRVIPILIIVLAGAAFLVGCAPAATPEPTLVPPTETVAIPTATSTSAPTATQTLAPTATVTLIPTPDLSGIKVLGAGPNGAFYLVNFFLPGIDREYIVQTDKGIPFTCKIYQEYPDRLICNGIMLPWGEQVKFSFKDPSSGQVVYTLDYVTPDRDWGFAEKQLYACVHPNACPQRGQGMHCEVEDRIDSKGQFCLIGTCIDLCGFCVSIDTCDNQ